MPVGATGPQAISIGLKKVPMKMRQPAQTTGHLAPSDTPSDLRKASGRQVFEQDEKLVTRVKSIDATGRW